ncbi:hypothetical protein KHM83_00715 [Fusibacter paucivorans]|uniref:Uncharacterized protein n=1 Tax=Fusibacter paucivorans TaxID=76009 RepID=A0ABS5PJ97_9FIRM|nr:hypothetical protein [Fusibacter paucivorans]MBS7525189.1 hypothetical protein [Fusibacter paucivorans]
MNKNKSYEDSVYRLGRVSAIIFFLATLMLPAMLWFKWGLLPTKEGFIAGISVIAVIIIPILIGEFLSYAPIVGAAGYFVMLLSGNWMNIKIPASIVALEATELDSNSEEGDVISTMAVATSAIVTEVIIIAGVLLLTPFSSFFEQPAIKTGFEQIVPALFGALYIATLVKNPKAAVVPTIVGFAIVMSQVVNSLFFIPVIIAISVLIATVIYKIGNRKQTIEEPSNE